MEVGWRCYQFQVGEDQFNFNGLKFAGVEVETIAKEIPGTTTFFNKDFSRDNVESRLGKYSIVHLATHAEFVSGLPYESFILFGSGEWVTLADIDKWKLADVDLVVLSACRTATSGEIGMERKYWALAIRFSVQEQRLRSHLYGT